MPKKILIVVSSLNLGGTENHIRQVFPELNGDEFQIAVYTTHQRGKMAKSLQEKGVKIYSSRLAECLHRFGKSGRLFAYVISTFRLLVVNLFYRPDIVHCYLPGPYLLGGICARLTCRGHLIMSRRSMNNYQKEHPRLAKYEHRLHQKTSRILANSKRVFNQLFKEEAVAEDKLRLIYNGIDLAKYREPGPSLELKSRLRIDENALVMVIVANLFLYKGHQDLLQALVLIKDQLPEDWKLLCVGRDEGTLRSLCDYAAEHDISSHVLWLDQRDDVPSLLSIADIGILCSHQEGFSNSVIEGMAAGLPMVVTDVGGNPEAVLHEETGLVVSSEDPVALAAALLRLAYDQPLRKQMGAAASKRAEIEFSLDRCVNAYREIYMELN